MMMCMCVWLALLVCVLLCCFFFFKQKTAYEMRISDWSSDVCSSDLAALERRTLDAVHQHLRRDVVFLAVVAVAPAHRQRQAFGRMRVDEREQRIAFGVLMKLHQRRRGREIGRAHV